MKRAFFEAFWNDSFDQQQLAARWNGAAAIVQDRYALFIVPIVQHRLQQVDVAAARDRFEKIASDKLTAFG